ncbi:amidohydrolase [Candidatus Rariloculus sp.]|uniref:amidohydrolase n=1 Tax=Candidatus Rariloculus sp. TaxID=3101265 RepID=UPI003D1175E4
MKVHRPLALTLLTAVISGVLGPLSNPASHAQAQVPGGAAATAPDRIFTNGKVLTVDRDFSVAEAIAVRGDRVLAVGSSADMLALAGPETETTDLDGRTVLPGLIDNHMHFVRATRDWYRHARLDGVTSRESALALIAARASALPDGEWVLAIGGWNIAQFGTDYAPFTLAELDRTAPDRPLYLQEGYSRGFANSEALRAAGIGAGTSFDGRGTLVRDDAGNPTGELVGGAMSLVTSVMPAVPADVWEASLRAAVSDMHRMGLTAVYDVGGNGVTAQYYDAVERAAESGNLTMRVFYSLNSQHGIGSSADEIVAALRTHSPDLSGLRFAQFGWGESTYQPMRAQPWRISRQDLEAYEAIALAAAEHGWQMHEHSMRDEKIRAMLDVFEAVDEVRSIADLRWTIAHTNGISPESIARANALGMVFATHSSSRLATPAAIANGATAPPFRTIHDSGGTWGLGSDATTVASPNPFHNIGWVVSGLSPAGERILTETVSREAALTAHTRSNAWLLFREGDLGSLEAGKLADFVVLDRDYMSVPADEIKDLRSVMTVVGGNVVHTEVD